MNYQKTILTQFTFDFRKSY